MDNQIPVTGFERHIKIDLDGVLMSVPYGYLAGTSRESATKWMSDEEKVYKGGRFDIYVHAVWKNGSWESEPFNRENSEKFVKGLKDGLPMIDVISIRQKSECLLNPKNLTETILEGGAKEIPSDFKEYKAYERFIENPFYHEFNYIKDDGNPTIIRVGDNARKNGVKLEKSHFFVSINSCIEGLSVFYYPSSSSNIYRDYSQQPTQSEVVEYHRQVEKLVKGFIK